MTRHYLASLTNCEGAFEVNQDSRSVVGVHNLEVNLRGGQRGEGCGLAVDENLHTLLRWNGLDDGILDEIAP